MNNVKGLCDMNGPFSFGAPGGAHLLEKGGQVLLFAFFRIRTLSCAIERPGYSGVRYLRLFLLFVVIDAPAGRSLIARKNAYVFHRSAGPFKPSRKETITHFRSIFRPLVVCDRRFFNVSDKLIIAIYSMVVARKVLVSDT